MRTSILPIANPFPLGLLLISTPNHILKSHSQKRSFPSESSLNPVSKFLRCMIGSNLKAIKTLQSSDPMKDFSHPVYYLPARRVLGMKIMRAKPSLSTRLLNVCNRMAHWQNPGVILPRLNRFSWMHFSVDGEITNFKCHLHVEELDLH